MADRGTSRVGQVVGRGLFVLGFLVALAGVGVWTEVGRGACCVPTGALLMLSAAIVGSVMIGMGWELSVDRPARTLAVLVAAVAVVAGGIAFGPVLADRPDRWVYFLSRFFVAPTAVALLAWGVARNPSE